jgi:hypothetical protein
MSRHITQRLPGGSADRLDGGLGHVEIAVDIAPHVQFGRHLAGLPLQRGPEIPEAWPAAVCLPGQ